jgi:hypothetical protein
VPNVKEDTSDDPALILVMMKSFKILAILIAAITENQRSTKSIRLAEKTFCMVF